MRVRARAPGACRTASVVCRSVRSRRWSTSSCATWMRRGTRHRCASFSGAFCSQIRRSAQGTARPDTLANRMLIEPLNQSGVVEPPRAMAWAVMICLGTLATVEAAACLHDPMCAIGICAIGRTWHCGSIDELLKKKNLQPKKSANKKHDHERPRRESASESVSPTLKLTRRERRRSNTTNSTDSRSTDRDSACAE